VSKHAASEMNSPMANGIDDTTQPLGETQSLMPRQMTRGLGESERETKTKTLLEEDGQQKVGELPADYK